MRLRSALVFCLLTASLFYTISQTQNHYPQALLNRYREASDYYQRSLYLSGQTGYSEAEENRLNRLALDGFSEVVQTIKKRKLSPDSILFFSTLKMGELEHYFENFEAAFHSYQQAVACKPATLSDSFLLKPFVFSGIICYNQNRFDSAAHFFARAEKIQSLFPQPLLESERLYNNLGVLFYESGNYGQAKNYFEKAAELLSEQNPYYKELYVNYRINIATSLFKLEEYSRADSVLQSLLPFNVLTNEVYNNIGLVYLHSASYEKAISYFRKVSYSNRLSVGLSNDLANAFIQTNQIDSAKKYLAEAMTANTKYFKDAPNNNHGLTLKYLGDLAIKQLNNRAALANYQKALHQFYPAFRDTNRLSNPRQYSGVFSYINLFHVLVAKANTIKALDRQTGHPQWAKEELAVYRSAFALINYVEHSYDSDGARMFLNKIRYTLHDGPVNVCYALYNRTGDKTYLEQAYFFDQQNKASVLSYNRWNTAPNDRRGRAEKEIKSKLTRLALKADNLTDSTQRRNLAKSIRDYEIELGKMEQQKGGNNRASENIPPVVKLQSGLDGTTSIVSYHLSDSVLTCFVIGKTYFDVRYQKLYRGFANDLLTFTKALRGAGEPAAAASKRLYGLLIGNVLKHNPERLIIIPENELAYIPFEALQDSAGNYLIQKKAVQYQYATALLSPQKKNFKNASGLAFAPFAAKGFSAAPYELSRLPQSLIEARSGSATILLDSAATKKAFIRNSNNQDIIHLATHAFAPNGAGNKSFIAFYPSDKNIENAFLYAPEIYDLDLSNTQLVILSACETGAGDLVRGEGIMSISRAFAYAGCPNVITSLWKADDVSTGVIIESVNGYLQKGYSVDAALRSSKIDYLRDKKLNPRMKHPAYWSHIVFIGAYQKEDENNYRLLITCAGSVALVVAVWLFLRRRRRHAGIK